MGWHGGRQAGVEIAPEVADLGAWEHDWARPRGLSAATAVTPRDGRAGTRRRNSRPVVSGGHTKHGTATGASGPTSEVKSFSFVLHGSRAGKERKNCPQQSDALDDTTPAHAGQHFRRVGFREVASGSRRSLTEVARDGRHPVTEIQNFKFSGFPEKADAQKFPVSGKKPPLAAVSSASVAEASAACRSSTACVY